MYHYRRDQVKRGEEGPFSADAILGVLPLSLLPGAHKPQEEKLCDVASAGSMT